MPKKKIEKELIEGLREVLAHKRGTKVLPGRLRTTASIKKKSGKMNPATSKDFGTKSN